MSDFIEVIEKYISQVKGVEHHRYTSWENCYEAFGGEQDVDLALHLGFYLASWGMYRGSGGLLQKSHKIHDGAVELIKGAIPSLRCSPDSEIDEGAIEKIIQLKERLEKHYKGFKFVRLDKNGKKSEPVINPTETLMSKIMLGSLGCVPAFDRYFIAGMKVNGLENRRFNEKGLQELFGFLASDQCELQKARIIIKDKSDTYYSDMKILDMYFWQKGFEKEIKGNGAK